MTTYTFSTLTNNQIIAFNPLTDVLVFDTYMSGGVPVTIRPAELLINETASGVQFAVGGKSIVLSGISLDSLGTSTSTALQNIRFTGAGILLVGEGTTNSGGQLPNVVVGGAGDDALLGLGDADTLDGGAGSDLMVGGLGGDTYKVDNAGDVVTEENAPADIDTVQASVTYTLTNYVENLVLLGNASISGTGNTLANVLTGNGNANVLDGKTGADTMIGGDGNDSFFVDNSSDRVIERNSNPNQIDTVNASINYTLGATVENLVLMGTSAIHGVGNLRNNQITGNGAANALNGLGGTDTMQGGDGNDTYIVDDALDVIVETNNSATQIDLVASTISYTLGNQVENLRLLGSANINGTGNSLNNVLFANTGDNVLDGMTGNDTVSYADVSLLTLVPGNPSSATTTFSATAGVTVDLTIAGAQNTRGSGFDTLIGVENVVGSGFGDIITGNSGNNILDGNAGDDLLTGGLGNDTFVVDGADIVVELNTSSGGLDTVLSSVSYRLAANVENLVLTGSSGINGTGNELANRLTGNSGANYLDGGSDADKMDGGSGNDTFVVDNLGDEVTDSSGTDLVLTYVNFVLGSSIENLRLMGQNALNGTGNSSNNIVWANVGNNVIDGGSNTTTGDTLSYQFGANAGVTVNLSIAGAQATGGSGTDTVSGFENLTGSDYNDLLSGNEARNTLDGLGGIDTLSYAGSSAAVTINLTAKTAVIGTITDAILNFENIVGSAFDDILIGDLGNNVLDGGTGSDTVSYANVKLDEGGVVVSLATATAQNTFASGIDTLIGIENLTGSQNDDSLAGSNFANIIDGGDGSDDIQGNKDADTLTGGNGNDRFIFRALVDSLDTARDTISDFSPGVDELDVAAIDARPATAANDAFTFLGVAASFTAAGQIRLEQFGADTIVHFSNNATQASEMTIVLLNTTAASLSAADFIL